jgi:hypothetical protein
MTKILATFTSRRFADGSTVLVCRETGQRYSFNDERHPYDSVPVYRDGSVMAYRRGRAPILALIESDARWQIRDDRRREREAVRGHRVVRLCAASVPANGL